MEALMLIAVAAVLVWLCCQPWFVIIMYIVLFCVVMAVCLMAGPLGWVVGGLIAWFVWTDVLGH